MVQNDKFDEKLFDYFKNNQEIPEKITNGINNVNLQKERKKIFNFHNLKKVAVAAVSLITVSAGVVLANTTDIVSFIKNIFNDNDAVNTAVENGYVYEAPTVYTASEDTKMKITEMIMDDYTLDLNMLARLDKEIDVTGIDSINIPDMIITDDENKILYSSSSQKSIDFCNQKGIDSSYDNIKNITTNTSSSIFIRNADTNSINFLINLSASDGKFPLSKEIYVSFNTIEMTGNNKNYTISGNWNTEIKVPDKFLNRESILYKVTNCNNENVYKNSIKAEVYETGMNFEMTMYWGDYNTWHNKSEELRKKDVLSSQLIKQESSYVINENGEKFYPLQSSSSDGGYSFNTDGKLVKWETFGLTKFNITDKLKVVLTTIDNNEIIIDLERLLSRELKISHKKFYF